MLTNAKTYFLQDKGKFVQGGFIWIALNSGKQVTLDGLGTILEFWDPKTGKTYSPIGVETGWRDKPFLKVTEHNFDLITFLPGVLKDTLDDYQKAGKILYGKRAYLNNCLARGYEVTLDDIGNITYIRNPVNGHEISGEPLADLTEVLPDIYPARDKTFDVEDSLSWSTVEYVNSDGSVKFKRSGRNFPGTGEVVSLKDLTATQISAAVDKVEEEISIEYDRYINMITLIDDNQFEKAKEIMSSNDTFYFDQQYTILSAEKLKEYAVLAVKRTKEWDEDRRSTIKLLKDEFDKKSCLIEHPIIVEEEILETPPPGGHREGGYARRYIPGE